MSRFITKSFTGPEPTLEAVDLLCSDLPYDMAMEASLDPVTEGYVGKTQNLQKIEQAFDSMIKKYGSDSLRGKSSHILDDCPEKREIEMLLEKEFGFAHAEIIIRPVTTVQMLNCPKSMILRDFQCEMPTSLTAHGEKYYDESHNYCFYCTLFSELFNGMFTADELTAGLLHEVGHNFDVCTMSYIGDVLFWISMFSPIGLLVGYFRQEIGFAFQRLLNAIDSITPLRMLANFGIQVGRMIHIALGPLGNVGYLANILNAVYNAPSQVVTNLLTFGFASEKFADSFVTAYGYGPSMISFFDKLDKRKMTTNRGFLIDTWTWAGTVAPTFLNIFLDPHPENQSRAKMILDDMRDLSNNPHLPNHMRRAVKADYERCAKAYEAFLQVSPNDREAMALRFSRNFKERLGGKIDFRTYLYRLSAVQAGVWRNGRG